MNDASTSAVTAEVKPKQSAEAKLVAEILQAWAALQQSDANWAKNGLAFGKKCLEWRKKYSKQGSRKGLGFEAFCAMHGINYRKARYWADHYDKKMKPQYEGGESGKTTTKEKKAPKPKGFVLDGLSDTQHWAMSNAETNSKAFAQFAYRLITNPTAAEVRFTVERCLRKLEPKAQVVLLAELADWAVDLEEQIKEREAKQPEVAEQAAAQAAAA